MWALIVALLVVGVLVNVTASFDRTVASTQTKTKAQTAAVYHVAVPTGMKAFPAELEALP